ncbi:lipopolysaccharide biosynthesis protein [Enterovirga rhinocerotis]|uniref:O-antigen/teichoic acid export membrane protein n=1 Tax=Enterovirga rhinocerotis TaxID=1339210 RepID=A0A4R7BVI2_9HYPH|nr:lipopolysaccharide biosynthesis protein [Enterovirga rhinocerotis]TDR89082.1 O-antigen/teichoic acid export membrane protein [Enterovirga rhinocerotis]
MAAGALLASGFDRLRSLREGPARSALTVFSIRIASAIVAYGAQVLVARLLGNEQYGIYATVWVWTAMIGHSLTFGLSQGASRFLPAHQAHGHLAEARGYLLAGTVVTIGASLAVALAGAALLFLWPGLLAEPYRAPLLLAACILPLFAFQDYLEGVARSQDWGGLAIAPPYLLRQSVMMAAMVAAIMLGAPAEAGTAMACMLAAAAVATAIQGAILLVRLRRTIPPGARAYRWRHWFGATLPIAAIDLAHAGFTFVDVVVLSFLMPPSVVGLYFAATRIQQFVAFVHFAAQAASAQRYSAAHAVGDRAALARLVGRMSVATAGATAVVGVVILAASPLLLAMFGPDFQASVPILAILVAGTVIGSLFGPAEDLLTMLAGEKLCAVVTAVMLAIAVLLCLALVPAFGAIGAALAIATATVLRAAALAVAARRILGLATPVWSRRTERNP